jgi:glucose/arabinose dehydrogenase
VVRFIFAFCLSFLTPVAQAEIHLDQIHLPPGFKIEIYTSKISGARSMAWGSNGILFVGSRDAGNVYAVTPSKEVIKIATKLNMPNGVAYRDGDLYVAEVDRLLRYKEIEKNLKKPPKPDVLYNNYPSELHHGWKFIAFGPDGKLYVPVGAPCNICEPKDPYAAITRVDQDGKNREVFARGVRNSVGFDWHPVTHELWFTDNGRDMLGDDLPSDELNHATKAGLHFGYPYCHQGDTLDPEFGKDKKCSDYTPPEQKLGAHVATLGMRFYTGSMFPPEYKNQIFIAEHGSWNRTHKTGYRIALVRMSDDHHTKSNEVFADGWLQKETAWGRPVDVIVAPDGALLVSDDTANAIYRISYAKP